MYDNITTMVFGVQEHYYHFVISPLKIKRATPLKGKYWNSPVLIQSFFFKKGTLGVNCNIMSIKQLKPN